MLPLDFFLSSVSDFLFKLFLYEMIVWVSSSKEAKRIKSINSSNHSHREISNL